MKKYSSLFILFAGSAVLVLAIFISNGHSWSGQSISAASASNNFRLVSVVPGPADNLPVPVISSTDPAAPSETKGCVFRTLFGEEKADSDFIYKTPAKCLSSIKKGLAFLAEAQQNNGGWGAGSHSNQGQMDPHAVATDPATTSMVAMAMMRSGSTFNSGTYSSQLKKSLEYILDAVEKAPEGTVNITTLTNTQIQSKLGVNIDVVLSAQYLSNIISMVENDKQLHERVKKCLDNCVQRIQKGQNSNGSFSGAGWAGVLQSSLATNALESAGAAGIKVDAAKLEKAKDYQIDNVNAGTGEVKTSEGAGIMLYTVSGSSRASAKDARAVEEDMEAAKKAGKLPKSAPVTADNLQKIGYDKTKALKLSTTYKVYNSANTLAQQDNVVSGFGNNGGEEFLSFLQTGESMIIGKDRSWKKWYDDTSGRLISIQNANGTWNGHHCITSPVFCTATCLLVLTVNNDVEKLMALGKQ
jgi:hypothetical protein